MNTIKAWLSAARLRTLPLSVSGVIVGSSLGYYRYWILECFEISNYPSACYFEPIWKSIVFWLAIFTTIGFQVLSNFANDYGDGIKGTDDNRQGEQRAVASGIISEKSMKRGMIITTIITLLIALLLIYTAFGDRNILMSIVFFGLGTLSVIAAIKYTVGKKAYGYSGFGDVFVFLFFGLLSVLGSYYLFTQDVFLDLLLPATTIGFFSMAVLNLNNMRDIVNDKIHSKNTLVVQYGMRFAKKYHYILLIVGMLCAIIYTISHYHAPLQFIYLLSFIPMLLNIKTVYKNEEPVLLDSELKKVALSTFAFALLFSYMH